MAKNKNVENVDSNTENVPPSLGDPEDSSSGTNGSIVDRGMTVADKSLALSQNQPLEIADDLDFIEVIKALRGRDAEVESIVTGRTAYWPGNVKGMVCAGKLGVYRTIPTRLMGNDGKVLMATLHPVQLTHPCHAISPDGEPIVAERGTVVTVLERTMLKELRMRLGQEVFIGCLGKRQGRSFSYWEYRVMGIKQTPAEMQASAQAQMAHMQQRLLEQNLSKESSA